MRSTRGSLLLVAVVLAAGAGCGEEGGEAEAPAVQVPPAPKELDVTLDGYQGPENLGILMAAQRGFFVDAGLEVWVRTPGSRLRPLRYVAEREVALAVSHQPQVAMAREKGVPVVAFGSLVAEPTAALIWLRRAKIDGIADLKGKTVAITGLPFEEGFLEAFLARAGLGLGDVRIVHADYELLPTLVGGRADAILGSWNLEGAELEARGLEPVITRVESLGVPPYDEFVLITRPDRLSKEPETLRRFMAAVARGSAAAIEDPEAAARLIARIRAEKLTEATEAKVEATLPLLSESGRLGPDRESDLVDWMREEGMLPS